MFGRKFEKATADWPKTRPIKKGGIHVTGKYVQPSLVKPMQGIYVLGAIFGWMYIVAQTPDSLAIWGIAAVALAIGYPLVWRPLIMNIFAKSVNVKIFPDAIHVSGKKYSRAERIEFRVEQHQKALAEARKEEKAQQKKSATYREAVEIVMQYGEKRVVIAEMIEKELEKAKALVIRLQNICNSFDEAIVRMADGQISPAGEHVGGDFGPEPDIR